MSMRTSRFTSSPRGEIPGFVERKRAEGCAIDAKMLLLLAAGILG